MAERDGEGVGGIRWLRWRVEAQDAGDHRLHLLLVGRAVPGHRRLHLTRCVGGSRQPGFRRDQQRDAARLSRAHHSVAVVLREDPLYGDSIRSVIFENGADAGGDGGEAISDRHVWGCADHSDVYEGAAPRTFDVDDADTAASEPGVDAEHT